MSKEKEKTQVVNDFARIYRALLQHDSDPVVAARLAGAKYGKVIWEYMLKGQTLSGLAESEQNYMIKVIANIIFPTKDGDLLSNLMVLSFLPVGFRASLHDSGRDLVYTLFLEGQKIERQNESSTTSVSTTSVSTTISTTSSTISTTTTTTSTELPKEDEKMKSVTTLLDVVSLDSGSQAATSTISISVSDSGPVDATITPLSGDLAETLES